MSKLALRIAATLSASATAFSAAGCGETAAQGSAGTRQQHTARGFAGVEVLIGIDTTNSAVQRGEDIVSRRCSEAVALLREKFNAIGTENWMITVVQTGSIATQGNPIVVVPRRSLFGKRPVIENHEQKAQRLAVAFDDLHAQCKVGAAVSDTSAVHSLAETARDQALALCPVDGGRCKATLALLVSDLVEEGKFSQPGVALTPIDMQGVQLTVCGIGETAGPSSTRERGKGKPKARVAPVLTPAERMAQWRPVLGATAELRPLCPSFDAATKGPTAVARSAAK